jgi:hypothetical protein
MSTPDDDNTDDDDDDNHDEYDDSYVPFVMFLIFLDNPTEISRQSLKPRAFHHFTWPVQTDLQEMGMR